ncbi:MAG: hypothetical protein KDE32_10470 [Novosphingobium sp.]|nr:hypothetical protein [Novosphingobium sp.]
MSMDVAVIAGCNGQMELQGTDPDENHVTGDWLVLCICEAEPSDHIIQSGYGARSCAVVIGQICLPTYGLQGQGKHADAVQTSRGIAAVKTKGRTHQCFARTGQRGAAHWPGTG